MQHPIVFISYSWDDEKHKEWVLQLSNRLVLQGVDVQLDRYELKLGRSVDYFIDKSLQIADKVIVIFTPNYKVKAEERKGGVGMEYSVINRKSYTKITHQDFLIPVLRSGNVEDSIPSFMQQFIHQDMRDDDFFENSITSILREIFGEQIVKKPNLGSRPDFNLISNAETSLIKSKFLPIENRVNFGDSQPNWVIIDRMTMLMGRFNNGVDRRKFERRPLIIYWPHSFKPSFSCGLVCVKGKEGKFGFINVNGELVIPFDYEETDVFTNNLVAVKKDGKWGLINDRGAVQIDFDYENMFSPVSGLVFCQKFGRWSICDEYGDYLIKQSFASVEDLYSFYSNSITKVFDILYPTLSDVMDFDLKKYHLAITFCERARAIKGTDEKKEQVEKFDELLKKERLGFLNIVNEFVSRDFFVNKIIEPEKNTFSVSLEEKNGLWGVKSEGGSLIFEHIFYEILEFYRDRSFARINPMDSSEWVIVDNTGNILCE